MREVLVRRLVAAGAVILCVVFLIASQGCEQSDTTRNDAGFETVQGDADTATSSDDSDTDPSIADIIQANSNTIDEVGRAAGVMMESSDIIMRYSHFTDGHTTPVRLCPECWPEPAEVDDAVYEDPEEDIPETMAQLLRDSRDLRLSVARLTSSASAQQAALRHHLEKLRAVSDKDSPAKDKAGGSATEESSDDMPSVDAQAE